MRLSTLSTLACATLISFTFAARAADAPATDKAAEAKWTDNYAAAVAQAKKDGKMLLLDFTGSDWCGYCIKLHEEVFSKPEFATWANAKFVCVELDYPAHKKLADDVKKQNDDMKTKYAIRGYPTIIILSSDEKELTRSVGFGPGTPPATWMKRIDDGIAKGK